MSLFRIRNGLWRLVGAQLGLIALSAHGLASLLALQMAFAAAQAAVAPDKSDSLIICTAKGLQKVAAEDGQPAPDSGLDRHHHCPVCFPAAHFVLEPAPFAGAELWAPHRMAERLSPDMEPSWRIFPVYSVKNRSPPHQA